MLQVGFNSASASIRCPEHLVGALGRMKSHEWFNVSTLPVLRLSPEEQRRV